MSNRRILSLLVTFLVLLSLPVAAWAAIPKTELKSSMHGLWEDHILWTRMFVISALADLPDKGPTTQRLLDNQAAIGNSIKPYYGDAVGEKLTALLKDHILIASDVVSAAKANDTAKLEDAKKRWYTNADEIATFLSSANPKFWPLEHMKSMMREHLDLTTREVVARLQKDWTTDIETYGKINDQILMMADMLSEGITKQFPKKFK